jgi:hypothetical protein
VILPPERLLGKSYTKRCDRASIFKLAAKRCNISQVRRAVFEYAAERST